MTMTLDQMLALLPDNNTGQIKAADLRSIVTDMWTVANTQALIFNYQYNTATAPQNGKTNIAWTLAAFVLAVSKQTGDGGQLPVAVINDTANNVFTLSSGDRSHLIRGTITGLSVDQGSYVTFPVTVSEVVGTQPANNTSMNLSVFVYAEAT
jgi:hypothetical protein